MIFPNRVMKKRLHTTVDDECYRLIQKYLPQYGKVNRLIKDALLLLEDQKNGIKSKTQPECSLLELMEEANLVAFNAKTIELVVSGEIEKALCDNELEIVIRKIYGKPIVEVTLDEAVKGIRTCLLTTRKATKVTVREGEDGIYLLVTSNLGQNTDTIICEALRRFFEKNYPVKVSFEVFPQGYSVFIKPEA
jgi:hypothetical protein